MAKKEGENRKKKMSWGVEGLIESWGAYMR